MTLHYLYVFGGEAGPFKVGYSAQPKRRQKYIRHPKGVADVGTKILHLVPAGSRDHARKAERLAHDTLGEFRIVRLDGMETERRTRPEWFSCDVETATCAVNRAAEKAADHGVLCEPMDPGDVPGDDEFRINMLIDTDWLPLLDQWRKGQPDLPSRPEAVRRMVASAIGVKARGKKGRS